MVHGGRALLALAVVVALCSACVGPGRAPGMVDQAREQFSRRDFCPESRVDARHVLPIPVPPPVIANDAERNAMWRDTYERAALADPRQVVEITGCNERATYACWEFGGWGDVKRQRERVSIGWSCIRVTGQDVPVSMRSTTDDEQPKTTASSR